MLDFDFAQFVNKFKLPKWAVIKVGRTKSQSFAIVNLVDSLRGGPTRSGHFGHGG